ncbi:MAG: SDR family NAD(P)-dependent oxidoreductase [Polyangiaceae bacterium]
MFEETADRAIAIVGVGAVMPDAMSAPAFWENLRSGRYSISDVPADRWDAGAFYDPDPHALDKSYSKIGGWVRSVHWDPIAWKLPIPPKVAEAMDGGQRWAISCVREALADYGAPERKLDRMRTAVIFGNAMAGEKHYLTALRVFFPDFAKALREASSFAALPASVREAIVAESRALFGEALPPITEDTMPGELSNCLAGRIANVFDLHGPNYTVDAACASAVAAISTAMEGLIERDYDVAISGGIDRNMGPSAFVKFCKIGALSATGTRPYADGADGFVMGEGAGVFVLKRLADAEKDGDKIYAVIRGIGGSSDGKGKGITAPNPVGQKLAVERAWDNARLDPATCSLVEGHGTSTRVGDVVEVEALGEVFAAHGAKPGSVPLGSVKSNIGHLKAAAGAAGLLKLTMALHHKELPPSLGFERPNPNIDFDKSPFRVNTQLRAWEEPSCGVRRGGLSAFGFGGTNFHAVVEEHQPGRITRPKTTVPVTGAIGSASGAAAMAKAPLRGALLIGGASPEEVAKKLTAIAADAKAGRAPKASPPTAEDLGALVRLAIDYGDAKELADKAGKTLKAFAANDPAAFRMLRQQGIFVGMGKPGKVAFLYTGQGSQYVGMLGTLRKMESIVASVFTEADKVMTPLLGRPLSRFIFVDEGDEAAKARAEEDLKQTAITQPAILATDIALTRLLGAYGVFPDMVMGHSLGEYGALVASGALPFADALEAVSARGREMTKVSVADNGWMVAVTAPIEEIKKVVAESSGYVVIANLNSRSQAVIGGASAAVEDAMKALQAKGFQCVRLPVSHAFHTSIVAPASGPLRSVLERLHVAPPKVPVVANVTGELYPMHEGARPEMIDLLSKQVAAPVEFVKGLETLYAQGARVFVEVGPKKALAGFVDDVLGGRGDVVAMASNHPKVGDVVSFNQALCGLYAAGVGAPVAASGSASLGDVGSRDASTTAPEGMPSVPAAPQKKDAEYVHAPSGNGHASPVVISGAALGLPGTAKVFDDANLERILGGEEFIDVVPSRFRRAMLDKHVTRIVKGEDGSGSFQTIDNPDDVIRLAARAGAFDLEREFGVAAERIPALDIVTQLAIGAGLDALRDAGIPLVRHYKTTSKGTKLPDRWGLPDAMRDDTGILFASAFPGYDAFADDMARYYKSVARREQIEALKAIDERLGDGASEAARAEIRYRRETLEAQEAREPYVFDRRFLFRILAMGHSQFAELIGARGPNTQVNSACASTTQAVSIAEDWIRSGRARRVIIIAADDVTSDRLLEWMGAGFLITGAAATDDVVERAALPFDRRRHGMLLGMGAAALVIESAEAAKERGVTPICQVIGTMTANSAFHGTRLDVSHITSVMESLVRQAEARGISRKELASALLFVSHETYTPARGGSASAEIHALRTVFGEDASKIVIANTKGFTGHPMGVGIEDVIAVKVLETGIVPPVPNFHDPDPELGDLRLSRGGPYPVRYALRLGAGFGSQISMTLMAWTPAKQGARPVPSALGFNYRIGDGAAYKAWVAKVTESAAPELEIVQRTLRVKDGSAPGSATTTPVKVTPVAIVTAKTPVGEAVTKPMTGPVGGAPTPPPPPKREAAPIAAVTVVAAPVIAAAPAAPAAPARSFADEVKERVLEIVAKQTGYPRDMLDMELDLEADLGIDTVKQAETFAAVRTAYEIPREDKLKLRDFPTLAHVVKFVLDRRPDLAAKAPSVAVTVIAPAAPVAAPAAVTVIAPVIATAPATAPATATSTPVVAEAAAGSFAEEVKAKVLDIVAAQTGYPRDMLDMELDLEADLGIDTVKQAETFAAVRTAYEIPREDKLKLRDFPTLAHVVKFVLDRRPDLVAAGGGAAPQVEVVSAPAASAAPVIEAAPAPKAMSYDAISKLPRRVPRLRLRPSLGVCKPTGVTIGEGTRVVVMFDEGGIGAALTERLTALGASVLPIGGAPSSEELLAQIQGFAANGPVHGVYWLRAADVEPAELDAAGWREQLRVRVKLLADAMRALYEAIAPAGTFLVAATRLGGAHGYDEAGAHAPMGGSVTGFVKAYKRERENATVKAVDFAASDEADEIAERLIDETLADPGAVEIGYLGDERVTIALEDIAPALDGSGRSLGKDSVVVVSGAAGSIVSAITADLAARSGATFYLLDLAPAPDENDPDLARFATDKEGLKRDLFDRIKARGERATPALVEKEIAVIERRAAALAAVNAIRAAGGQAHYRSVNLGDEAGVASALEDARRGGKVDLLLHAAGIEISRFLPDKTSAEWARVFDVKADGWRNLMAGLDGVALGAVMVFSSIAGRFGNGGQTDYSAGNDLLCKLVSSLRNKRPETKGIAIDWTAWSGIGMASRGSIPKMMELAGIDMLPPEAGIPAVYREIEAAGSGGEVLIGGKLGLLFKENDETGGLDVAKLDGPRGPMIGRVVGTGVHAAFAAETTLDPKAEPFLDHHRIDGTPVLPGVMGMEGFAEIATAAVPGAQVLAVRDMQFLAPFKFYRDEARALRLTALLAPNGDGIEARCQLVGARTIAGRAEPQITVHFEGRVEVTRGDLDGADGRVGIAVPERAPDRVAADIYRDYFHGPAYQVLEAAWVEGHVAYGRMASDLIRNHAVDHGATLIEPRAIELCFQTAGIWEMKRDGRMGLPAKVAEARRLRVPSAGPMVARVVAKEDGTFDAEVADGTGTPWLALTGYRTVALSDTTST